MSMLASFLGWKDTKALDQLCRHAYYFVLPAISSSVPIAIDRSYQFGEWLEWGVVDKNSSQPVIELKRGLNIRIGINRGTYYGEWLQFEFETRPWGRCVLDCFDRLILGYCCNGEWANGYH